MLLGSSGEEICLKVGVSVKNVCSSFCFILSAAAKPNLMTFGDCYINEGRSLTLSMTNHSKTDCVRFSWPEHPQLRFSPQVGCGLVT